MRRGYTALVLPAAALLLLLSSWWGFDGPIRRAAEPLVSPLRWLSGRVTEAAATVGQELRQVSSGRQRIADLERQVAELTVSAARSEVVEAENQALRRLAGAEVVKGRALVPAQVVSRGDIWLAVPTSASAVPTSASAVGMGVKSGQAVLTDEGVLVGVVDSVGEYVIRVKPVSHPDLKIAVVTARGVAGTLVGRGGEALLTQVLQKDPLEQGEKIISSGADDKLPVGVVVGVVARLREDPAAIYKSAIIEPYYQKSPGRVVFIWQ